MPHFKPFSAVFRSPSVTRMSTCEENIKGCYTDFDVVDGTLEMTKVGGQSESHDLGCVLRQQGAENAGKTLKVDTNGNLVISSSSDITIIPNSLFGSYDKSFSPSPSTTSDNPTLTNVWVGSKSGTRIQLVGTSTLADVDSISISSTKSSIKTRGQSELFGLYEMKDVMTAIFGNAAALMPDGKYLVYVWGAQKSGIATDIYNGNLIFICTFENGIITYASCRDRRIGLVDTNYTYTITITLRIYDIQPYT